MTMAHVEVRVADDGDAGGGAAPALLPRGGVCRGHVFHYSEVMPEASHEDAPPRPRRDEESDDDDDDAAAGGAPDSSASARASIVSATTAASTPASARAGQRHALCAPSSPPFWVTPQTPGAAAARDGFSTRNTVASSRPSPPRMRLRLRLVMEGGTP
jgi:hypothetical protein